MPVNVFLSLKASDEMGPSEYTPNTLNIGDVVTIQGSPEALAKLRDAIITVAATAAERTVDRLNAAVGGD